MNIEIEKYYKFKKKNTSNFILMFFIYSGLYFLYIKLSYISSPILSHEIIFKYSFLFFVLYLISLLIMILKEEIIITEDNVIIKKSFLFFCYSKKKLKINNIKKIAFYKFLTKRHLLLFPLYFRAYKNLLFQVNENKEEDVAYYFGYFLTKNEFLNIKNKIQELNPSNQILFLD